MSPDAIATRLDKYTASINAAKSAGFSYFINEDAAMLSAPTTEFSDGYGYTLWAAEFQLACMARGVSRVSNLAGRPSAKRVFWVPDNSAYPRNPGPHVRAPFAAAPYAADFRGSEANIGVVKVPLGPNVKLLSAYAAYEGTQLKRVALLNLRVWRPAISEERPKTNFKFSVPFQSGTVTVRRLRADRGVAAMGYDWCKSQINGCADGHNVTWAGEQWTKLIDNGVGHGGGVEKVINVVNGEVVVNVPDSEAVIVFVS